MKHSFSFFFLVSFFVLAGTCPAAELPMALDQKALQTIFPGPEKMHYSISWSGGIKIGDLYLTLSPVDSGDGLAITAKVTDYGVFHFFYPVNDTFVTFIKGPRYLPYRYEVHQLEGGHVNTHRLTIYDQERLTVVYQKNDEPQKKYSLTGTAYNEFSSFFITRALRLTPEKEEIVPTFVDEKRHEVAVKDLGTEIRKTLFGSVDTIKVLPEMNFKGLYDKDGETMFWLTNDECRIPVEINSKIMIGSLVAELVEYSNPSCSRAEKKTSANSLFSLTSVRLSK